MSLRKTLLHNGRIWRWSADTVDTVASDPARSDYDIPAQWMEVIGQRVGRVGTGEPPEDESYDEVIDLEGRVALPGLQDSHIHVFYMGEASHYVNLEGCKDLKELQDRVRRHAEDNPKATWIVGCGWAQDSWPVAEYPTKADVDVAVKDRPVFLWRACWHVGVANSRALDIAGVRAGDIPKMEGGEVEVKDGEPTGLFKERATELITKHIVEGSEEIKLNYLRESLHRCISSGLTAVHTNDAHAFSLYQKLQAADSLPVRVFLTPNSDEVLQPSTPQPGTQDGLIYCNRVKVFSDGSLGAETAALRQPYRESDNRGILIHSKEGMEEIVRKSHEAGYRLEIHAIGDRAAEQVLDALEAAQVGREHRPILTHCQVLGPDLIEKMATLGVVANIQPSFVITDSQWVRKRLPESVLPFSYCWRRLIESGVICAGGSDAPIETCNPFQGLSDAIFRRKLSTSSSPAPFLPDQCLTFAEALKLYTLNGAYACGLETQLGALAPGFLADFVIVEQDIIEHVREIAKTSVYEVWVDGKRRYNRLSSSPPETSQGVGGNYVPGKNGPRVKCACCRW